MHTSTSILINKSNFLAFVAAGIFSDATAKDARSPVRVLIRLCKLTPRRPARIRRAAAHPSVLAPAHWALALAAGSTPPASDRAWHL